MSKLSGKKIIGILGGIGSGKSSVAEIFGQNGCAVINADRIAQGLLDEDYIKVQIRSEFGDGVFDVSGLVDRKNLAKKVFDDHEKLEKLNNIIHPPVMAIVEDNILSLNDNNSVKAIVLDIPLLVEVGWEKRCDYLVFVDCDIEKRLERAAQKGKFFKKQLKIRENHQISLDKKQKISDYIISNNSDFSTLNNQVEEILLEIFRN